MAASSGFQGGRLDRLLVRLQSIHFGLAVGEAAPQGKDALDPPNNHPTTSAHLQPATTCHCTSSSSCADSNYWNHLRFPFSLPSAQTQKHCSHHNTVSPPKHSISLSFVIRLVVPQLWCRQRTATATAIVPTTATIPPSTAFIPAAPARVF